jgi:hypothetical protein
LGWKIAGRLPQDSFNPSFLSWTGRQKSRFYVIDPSTTASGVVIAFLFVDELAT